MRFLIAAGLVLATPAWAQDILNFKEIPNSRVIETFFSQMLDNAAQTYVYDGKNKKLYVCHGARNSPLGDSSCYPAKVATNVIMPADIFERLKSMTGGDLASVNHFTILPLLQMEVPYQQIVNSVLMWNKKEDRIYVCRYIKNEYEFSTDIEQVEAFFFSTHQPEIYAICRLRYPTRE